MTAITASDAFNKDKYYQMGRSGAPEEALKAARTSGFIDPVRFRLAGALGAIDALKAGAPENFTALMVVSQGVWTPLGWPRCSHPLNVLALACAADCDLNAASLRQAAEAVPEEKRQKLLDQALCVYILYYNKAKALDALLDAGADANGNSGLPLRCAVQRNGGKSFAAVLFRHGADFNCAIRCAGNTNIMGLLLEFKKEFVEAPVSQIMEQRMAQLEAEVKRLSGLLEERQKPVIIHKPRV